MDYFPDYTNTIGPGPQNWISNKYSVKPVYEKINQLEGGCYFENNRMVTLFYEDWEYFAPVCVFIFWMRKGYKPLNYCNRIMDIGTLSALANWHIHCLFYYRIRKITKITLRLHGMFNIKKRTRHFRLWKSEFNLYLRLR